MRRRSSTFSPSLALIGLVAVALVLGLHLDYETWLGVPTGASIELIADLGETPQGGSPRLLSGRDVLPWALTAVVALGLALLVWRRRHALRVLSAGARVQATAAANRWTLGHDVRATAPGARVADLEHVLDIAALLLIGLDRQGHVQIINQRGCEVLGLDRGRILGRDWVESFLPVRERETMRVILDQVVAGAADQVTGIEGTVLRSDGTERLIEWRKSRLRDRRGRVIGVLGSGTDITERKHAERALSYLVTLETILVEASRSLVAAPADAVGPLVENALGAVARRMGADRAYVFVLSRDGTSMRNTEEWSATGLGLGRVDAPSVPTSLIPRWMDTLRHGDDIRIDDVGGLPETWRVDREQLEQLEVRAVAATAIRTAGRLSGFVAVEMLSGPYVWRDAEMRALGFLSDLIGGAFERRRNELKLLESRRQLEEIALYDPLTRLPNRRLLAERMSEAVTEARENGCLLAVCYLDLDGFKLINDTHGHKAGDRVLVTVASRLRGCLREADTVARLGGDEFVFLMSRLQSLADCAALLERVLAALAQPVLINGHVLSVTSSAGVALYPHDTGDAETLLRHADHAMYQAKQQGRNRYQLFRGEEGPSDQAHRPELLRIREAIEGEELRLHVQPQVHMSSGRVVGVEALVRWQHPDRGLLPPGEFLPLIEGDALLQQLDWWVMNRAVRWLGQWQESGLDLTMSLNLSACSLQDAGFIAGLQELLTQHPSIAPSRLLLEIAESEGLRDVETTASVIQACAVLGVRFALDGFGNGYASLTDFRCLPVQTVKIDQTAVRDILRSRDDRNLVQGVIGIARAFQRELIAEGVESAAHGLLLMDLGCEFGQGFAVADPMPPERLASWIAAYVPPCLWHRRTSVDWSAADLVLLSMEAVHRDWVDRVVRCRLADGSTKTLPELQPESCDFGRWYLNDGRIRYGELTAFKVLDALHRRVHQEACLMLEVEPTDRDSESEAIARLMRERDGFIAAIHVLQRQVLQGRHEWADVHPST
ncbi:MAG: EAL domain-containing protein [Thiocapsa sp.]|nr:EAL domain-containing protein [Thiocapsa sp.]MCG6985431.1 EAL domain-containing protein [Thiocapsa sp.]